MFVYIKSEFMGKYNYYNYFDKLYNDFIETYLLTKVIRSCLT